MVLLYTEGILERPGRDVPASTLDLARVAADIAADRALRGDSGSAVDRLTSQTLELLTRLTSHSDDITLFAAHRVTPPADLTLTVPQTPTRSPPCTTTSTPGWSTPTSRPWSPGPRHRLPVHDRFERNASAGIQDATTPSPGLRNTGGHIDDAQAKA